MNIYLLFIIVSKLLERMRYSRSVKVYGQSVQLGIRNTKVTRACAYDESVSQHSMIFM